MNRHEFLQSIAAFVTTVEFAYCDDLNIAVVEGDCRGSRHFAAELRMDVDEANELARELDIPIRFAWQG